MLRAAAGSSGDALLEAAVLEETLFLYGTRLAFSSCSLELLLATCGGFEAPPKMVARKVVILFSRIARLARGFSSTELLEAPCGTGAFVGLLESSRARLALKSKKEIG